MGMSFVSLIDKVKFTKEESECIFNLLIEWQLMSVHETHGITV